MRVLLRIVAVLLVLVVAAAVGIAVDYPVDDVRTPLRDLVDPLDRQALRFEMHGRAARGDEFEAQLDHLGCSRDDMLLVGILDRHEHRSLLRQNARRRRVAILRMQYQNYYRFP